MLMLHGDGEVGFRLIDQQPLAIFVVLIAPRREDHREEPRVGRAMDGRGTFRLFTTHHALHPPLKYAATDPNKLER